jgi:hypothetical protein
VASNKRPECIEQVLDLSILVMSIMVVASSSVRESIIHPPVIARRKLNKRERCPSGTCQEARALITLLVQWCFWIFGEIIDA